MQLHLQENGKKTWTFRVMQLICTNGFGEVWFQQGVGDVGVFLRCFRQRLVEQYTQDWAAETETKERYKFYSSFKCIFQSEKYIKYQPKKGVSGTLIYSLDLEYRLFMYIECVTKRMLSRGSYFVLCVKTKSRMNHMYYLDAVHITVSEKMWT